MILGFCEEKIHINYICKISAFLTKKDLYFSFEGVYYSIDREKFKKSFQKEFSKKVENKA